MRTGRKIMLLSGLTIFLVAPLSILVTVLLAPLWRWLEAATGIESLGHSGPALWCYGAVFGASSALAAGTILREARRPRAAARD